MWVTPATLAEAIVNATVAIATFSSFAFLIDLGARQRSEIRALKGILPTCAWCRKIRDADGQRQQMETYISDRSEAKFSHGICPECAKKAFRESAT